VKYNKAGLWPSFSLLGPNMLVHNTIKNLCPFPRNDWL